MFLDLENLKTNLFCVIMHLNFLDSQSLATGKRFDIFCVIMYLCIIKCLVILTGMNFEYRHHMCVHTLHGFI